MAITQTDLQSNTSGWISNATSANASACEIVKAAAGAGTNLIVDRLTIVAGATLTVTVGSGETTGAVTSPIVGPVPMIAGLPVDIIFTNGLRLAANTDLTVDASGSGNVCVVAQGRVK